LISKDEGAVATTFHGDRSGRWRGLPDDIQEKIQIDFIFEGDGPGTIARALETRRVNRGDDEGEEDSAHGEEDLDDYGEDGKEGDDDEIEGDEVEEKEDEGHLQAAFMERLVRWNDSNHDCLLFSNENYSIHFLSMDPEKMRARMHPQ
jgi:hypothetical protein